LFQFKRQANDVIETAGWKNMINMYPHLVAETFKALVNQQSPSLGSCRKRLKTEKKLE
jgi:hypothetical protein